MRLEPPAPLTCEAEIVVSPYCAWRMQKVCFLLALKFCHFGGAALLACPSPTMASILAALDADGDGDIDSAEWAAGYAQLGKTAPGVPNPAVWYGTMPDGPAFKVEQISMQNMYVANSKGQMPPSQLNEKTDYRDETKKGVMVGYAGHVPRARDKVGGSPLGNLPGTPVSPNGAVGIDMEAMMSGKFVRNLPEGREANFAQHGTTSGYVSEARDQSAAGGVKPKLYNQVRAPSPHGAKRDGGS